MGSRRALLLRWSRRDRLAVLVVALSVAFLVGTALVVIAAGAQTTAIAAGYGSDGHVSLHNEVEDAQAVAGDAGVVLPFAEATTPDGTRTVVIARPAASSFARDLGLAGEGVSRGTLTSAMDVTLEGDAGAVTVTASPQSGDTVLPTDWYLAPSETVAALGMNGALAIRPGDADRADGSPLRSALAFFRLGTREGLWGLGVGGLGAGVLVGVTIFGVSRMGVRDRLETIRVARATGAMPRTVVWLFALRAGMIGAVGAALGYAIGVILPNAAVSVAVAAGEPVSLPLTVTRRAVPVLATAVTGPVVISVVAGGLAAVPAATRPPGQIEGSHAPGGARPDRVWPSWLTPDLLDWRLVWPTTATLAAFVVLGTIAAGLGAAFAPVAAPDSSTVVEPSAPHPLTSEVPAGYADVLAEQGIPASGEILLLEVVDGRPFIAVGAEHERYAAVHDASLAAGRAPAGPGEAVIGASLATALDVDIGDRLVLGGSTRRGLVVVTVVGRYDAAGPPAGQLVVPLETARDLAGVRPGMVHIVSAERLPASSGSTSVAIAVVDVSVPGRVVAREALTVEVTVRNAGLEVASQPVAVRYAGETVRRSVEVGPAAEQTVTVEFDAGSPGERRLQAGAINRTVLVVDRNAIELTGVPAASPPDGQPLIRVTTLAGEPVTNATVAVQGQSWRTDAEGRTRIAFTAVGEVKVVATNGNRSVTETVSVRDSATRTVEAALSVTPSNPSVLVRPTATVTLVNPWAVPVEREVRLEGSGTEYRDMVTVDPGTERTVEVPLDRRPAGKYDLTLRLDGSLAAETSYRVTGDDRVAAALASSGRTGASGLSQAIEAALGNLRLVVGVVVGLAALMTVGATAAIFAAGVQARRRTLGIYRATGAGPERIVRLVLADALRIGLLASGLGLGAGLAAVGLAGRLGLLTVIGVRVAAVPSRPVLVGIAVAAVALTLLGAGVATWGVLRTSPGSLIAGSRYGSAGRSDD
jgi:ABC-type lipoprotein release transport system permease subunit